jgi:hypothetical protein
MDKILVNSVIELIPKCRQVRNNLINRFQRIKFIMLIFTKIL